MDDNSFGSVEVTGRWLGFYRHRSVQLGAFPITADLRQEGHRILGEMYDQITDRSDLLDRLLEVGKEDISPIDRLRLEGVVRQLGTAAVVVSSRLPDTSDIEGTITADQVAFTKAYRGSYEVKWTVGQKQIGWREYTGHKVHYYGHLDRERRFIAGEWIIRRRSLLAQFLPPRARGTFELSQKS